MSEQDFIQSIRLQGFLSFPWRSEAIPLQSLNVLIGPNGSGKSNLIEAFELLRAAPSDFAQAVREAGGVDELLWKGPSVFRSASIGIVFSRHMQDPNWPLNAGWIQRPYMLNFREVRNRIEIGSEVLGTYPEDPAHPPADIAYSYDGNLAYIYSAQTRQIGELDTGTIKRDQSILSQRKDPDTYPELTWLAERFSAIQTFREWTFGRRTAVRRAQATDLPIDYLLPGGANLALVLSEIQHRNGELLDEMMRRFLPRYRKLTTRVYTGAMTYYLHENNLSEPISSLRMSDGTLRFLALLAALLAPTPPSLLCIEEPELGLHPDAVALMAELLVEVSKRTQLVVTTHSDTLVSALTDHVDSVVVCENLGAGTVMERLEAERLKVWLEKYKLGEIWRMGELGGNP